MAVLNPILVLAVGAVALLAAGKKKRAAPSSDLPPPPGDEHPTTGEPPTTPPPDRIRTLVAYADYDDANPPPDEFSENDLWVADDCSGYAIGKKWKPVASMEGELWSPFDAYVQTMGEHGPVYPSDAGEVGGETPIRLYTQAAIQYANHRWAQAGYETCQADAPMGYEFPDYGQFEAAWSTWVAEYPMLAALWEILTDEYVGPQMVAAFEETFPEQAAERLERYWAAEAVAAGGDVAHMVDYAYHSAYPDCPAQIDPNNPAHAECQEIWLRLRQYVEEEIGP